MSKFYYHEEKEEYNAIVVETEMSGGWAARIYVRTGLGHWFWNLGVWCPISKITHRPIWILGYYETGLALESKKSYLKHLIDLFHAIPVNRILFSKTLDEKPNKLKK